MSGTANAEPVERILTRHLQGKQGVNISKQQYHVMKNAILESLEGRGEIALQTLHDEVKRKLARRFEGSISWYFTTVKLDLEAREIIERVPGKRPQHVRLKQFGS